MLHFDGHRILVVLRKIHSTSVVNHFFTNQLIMHMKMFYQKMPKKWNNFFYVPPPFLGSWCHQLHFLRKDWNPLSLPGPQVQPVTPLVAAWMASSCLAFGLPFPNHKSKPIQSFAWIIFRYPYQVHHIKFIAKFLVDPFHHSDFWIFRASQKQIFSVGAAVAQWELEAEEILSWVGSLRKIQLIHWEKYSWYIERNTVETFR